jgi:hypothetical protein
MRVGQISNNDKKTLQMYNNSFLDSRSITDLKQTEILDLYFNSGTNSIAKPFKCNSRLNTNQQRYKTPFSI